MNSDNETAVYAEPHEGIAGTDRAGDPLLTEGGSLVASELMGMLHRAVLVGNPAPVVSDMYARVSNPQPGDAVVIADSIYAADSDTKHKGVGYLVAVRAEWATTYAEWLEARAEDEFLGESDRFVERSAWYVQYGPNPVDICRWTNCSVLAIPRTAA